MGCGSYFLGYMVGFYLVGVAGLADAELSLNRSGFEQLQHRLVAYGLLQAERKTRPPLQALQTTGTNGTVRLRSLNWWRYRF
jgi:hypothetical protein